MPRRALVRLWTLKGGLVPKIELFEVPPRGFSAMCRELRSRIVLSASDAAVVQNLHQLAGLRDGTETGIQAPFRAPHHSVSEAGLVGRPPQKPRPIPERYLRMLQNDPSPDTRDLIELHTRPSRAEWGVPGEVHLAHKGVLVLDELCEFSSRSIEALSWALRDGSCHGMICEPALVACLIPAGPRSKFEERRLGRHVAELQKAGPVELQRAS